MCKILCILQKCNKDLRKGVGFWDKSIWTCCSNFSQLSGEYMWSAVNVLPNSAKFSDLTKRDGFTSRFVLDFWKIRKKGLQCRFQQCLGPVKTLALEGCCKTRAFGHWSNHISRGQQVPKYLSYGEDLFFKTGKIFCRLQKCNKNGRKDFWFFR